MPGEILDHVSISMPMVLDGEFVSYRLYKPLAPMFERMFEVIWSSDQAHLVDALAATGDEGRSSLR